MKEWIRRILVKVALLVAALLTLFVFIGPILWFFLLAIRPDSTNLARPPVIFFKPRLDALKYVFVSPGITRKNLLASIIEASGATLLAMPLALLAAYAFSRFQFSGKKQLEMWYLGLLLAPPMVFLIPYYVIMTRIGWLGTYKGIIAAFQSFAIPLGVWMLRGFIDGIPLELEEAAQVDGATKLGAILRIVVPLASPGIAVAGMFVFVFCWNNVVFPMALAFGDSDPLTVATMSFFATTGVSWNHIAAASVPAMAIPMLVFWSLRKYLVQGLSLGAVKG